MRRTKGLSGLSHGRVVGRWLVRRWFCGVQRAYIGDVSRLRASMDSGEGKSVSSRIGDLPVQSREVCAEPTGHGG